MIVARFSVRCHPDRTDDVAAALAALEAASRELPGVIHFDVARSLTDPNTLMTIEVFEDREALARSELQDEVAVAMALFEEGAAAGELEWSVWDASPSA